jgi:hypothetical protein
MSIAAAVNKEKEAKIGAFMEKQQKQQRQRERQQNVLLQKEHDHEKGTPRGKEGLIGSSKKLLPNTRKPPRSSAKKPAKPVTGPVKPAITSAEEQQIIERVAVAVTTSRYHHQI